MNKYSFKNDYSEGAHPNIIKVLSETNFLQTEGYSQDIFCKKAAEIIKSYLQNDDVDIHFVTGGTQANLIMISSILRPYEAVISADTGHINVHEAGAIENCGHKIITIDSTDGKLYPEQIIEVLDKHTDEHMVKPKAVYISNSTETGTVYKLKELQNISNICKQHNLYLVLDGARIASAIVSSKSNLTLQDIAEYCDIFTIGGTKNGAMLGEAIVICNENFKEDFRYNIKQKGGLIAKGRILGIQFLELFKNNLYYDLARHANDMSFLIADELKKLGVNFLYPVESNQIFPILDNKLINYLLEKFEFYIWEKLDENTSAIRIVTSWATDEKSVKKFIEEVKSFLTKIN
ncbi:threonine aldolase [Deferribacter desulfuricans SSM1]|uniref:Threonine aldolase n=1 Tax=Deferribacter desulfuricans (strain DSM 14783 / JCM 11476 / NBRC 101012 / SSM1) TaxID=639282 RepID=D3PDH9_DEFDS|nr:low specificity L-threonine aldolase [Deferribacter desulfuricans]BAI80652.1 threonine aldolase [Deferribacter desulfuricans SSM1]